MAFSSLPGFDELIALDGRAGDDYYIRTLRESRIDTTPEHWLEMVNVHLDTLLTALCTSTKTVSEGVRNALDREQPRLAYYLFTLDYPILAAKTKKYVFLRHDDLMRSKSGNLPADTGMLGLPMADRKRMSCRQAYGDTVLFTSRSGKILTTLRGGIGWFQDFFLENLRTVSADTNESTRSMIRAEVRNFMLRNLDKETRKYLENGTLKSSNLEWFSRSINPLEVGTYFHERFGVHLTRLAANEFVDLREGDEYLHEGDEYGGVSSRLDCFVPGRIICPTMPLLGVTPDGIVCRDRKAFEDTMDCTDPHVDSVSSRALPLIALEIKSVNPSLKPPKDEAKGPTTTTTVQNLLMKISACTVNKLEASMVHSKRDFKDLFMTKCGERWFSKAKVHSAKRPNDVVLTDQSRITTAPTYLKGGNVLEENLDSPVVVASANVYPLLAEHAHEHCFPEKEDKKAKKRRRCDTKGPRRDVVHVPKAVCPGKAVGFVVDDDGHPVKTFRFDKAPFVLNMKSEYFAQTALEQLTLSYWNPHVKQIFCGIIRDTPLDVVKGNVPRFENEAKMRLVYMYEVGLTTYGMSCIKRMILGELEAVASFISPNRPSSMYKAVSRTYQEQKKDKKEDDESPCLSLAPEIENYVSQYDFDRTCFTTAEVDPRQAFFRTLRKRDTYDIHTLSKNWKDLD